MAETARRESTDHNAPGDRRESPTRGGPQAGVTKLWAKTLTGRMPSIFRRPSLPPVAELLSKAKKGTVVSAKPFFDSA